MKKLFSFLCKIGLAVAIITSIVFWQIREGLYAKTSVLETLFPDTGEAMEQLCRQSLAEGREAIRQILSLSEDNRTFVNTVKALDDLTSFSSCARTYAVASALEMLAVDSDLRKKAGESVLALQKFFVEEVSGNLDLYRAFLSYYDRRADREALSEKDKYYLEMTLKGFRHSGSDLPEIQREEIQNLQKEIGSLCLRFGNTIASSQKNLSVNREDLEGLSSDFIDTLPKEQGKVLLTVNTPVYLTVMAGCKNREIRDAMYEAYGTRAYPENDAILKEIIRKRARLARILGFSSYAAYDIDLQMAGTLDRVRNFLDGLALRCQKKSVEELALLARDLPDSVRLTEEGKLHPSDWLFTEDQYKRKYLSVDEGLLSEYFPLEQTLGKILRLYERFFSLRIEKQEHFRFWHPETICLAVYPANGTRLSGYIILDLFPRPYKYGHACDMNIIPATYRNGQANEAVSVVVTNFPRGEGTKPALLRQDQLRTLFHEFGHALHDLLGRTEMAGTAGTNVKTDFVEMPSQMLEEWASDRRVLEYLGRHYMTGDPIPSDLIDRMRTANDFGKGIRLQRQLEFSYLSLALFDEGEEKDPYQTASHIRQTVSPVFAFDPRDRMYASFGHLTGYGAKYYGYLWAKVFALDLFDSIKQQGLFDPASGSTYVKEVIGQGGSVDPNKLLQNFLGREPDGEAFFRNMGIEP